MYAYVGGYKCELEQRNIGWYSVIEGYQRHCVLDFAEYRENK